MVYMLSFGLQALSMYWCDLCFCVVTLCLHAQSEVLAYMSTVAGTYVFDEGGLARFESLLISRHIHGH